MNKFASSEWYMDCWSDGRPRVSERTCKTRIRSLWTSIQKPAHTTIIYHKILSIGLYTGSFKLSSFCPFSAACILICTQHSSHRKTKSSKLWYIRCIDSYRYIVNDLRNLRWRRSSRKSRSCKLLRLPLCAKQNKTKQNKNRYIRDKKTTNWCNNLTFYFQLGREINIGQGFAVKAGIVRFNVRKFGKRYQPQVKQW